MVRNARLLMPKTDTAIDRQVGYNVTNDRGKAIMSQTITPTWCGMCHARCGLLLTFEGGKAVKVQGDPEFPSNRGATCERGRMMLEHLYHPDRLNHPLRRVGARGAGQWERVSWAEAMDDVAARLARLKEDYGAETLAMTRGTYRTYHWDARRFFNLFGSPNITGANPICYNPSVVIESAMCGALPYPDLERCACAVILGSCRSNSAPVTHWPKLKAAKKRGAQLIVVDPRRTKEAEMADIWLQNKPGSDAILLLAWLHVICEEGLFDRQFVQDWTLGFDEIAQLARQFPPDRAERATWVPKQQIVHAARTYATTKPAVITWGHGIDKSGPNAESAIKARAILRAVTGNLDIPGGEQMGWSAPENRAVTNLEMELNDQLPATQRHKMLGASSYPLFSFRAWEQLNEAIGQNADPSLPLHDSAELVSAHPRAVFQAMTTHQPYPVRALICQAANPLLTLANPKRTLEALRQLDLLVVMDYYLTPTAAIADTVFPAASTVERDDLTVAEDRVTAYPKAMEPLYERRSDYAFWMELGRRLGQEKVWPWHSIEHVNDYRLRPLGLSFRDLVHRRSITFDTPQHRRNRFGTPSGKVELTSGLYRKMNRDPMPHVPHGSHLEKAPTDEEGLILITGSGFLPMYHSEQRQWPTARRKFPDPLVSMHPDVAKKIGVCEGDWVRIQTAHGSMRQKAHLTDSVHPRVVDAQHGWWFPERECHPDDPFGMLESNANALCDDDPESCCDGLGGWAQTGIPCRVSPDFTGRQAG